MPKRPLSAKEKARYERFRRMLAEQRENAGLSQGELGSLLVPPRSQSYVGKIEVGLRRLDALEYFDIARAVGFDPCALIEKLEANTGGNVIKKPGKRSRSRK